MSFQALNEFVNMNERDMYYLYCKIGRRQPNSLERAYTEMLNMPLSKKNINLEFIKAGIPFPFTVGLGDLDLVKIILKNGVDVNAPTIGNCRALHMACLQGNLKMTELLLQNKADVNALDSIERTPIMTFFNAMVICKCIDVDGCYRMTQMLISYGAKLGSLDMETITYAVMSANVDTLILLVDKANGDINYDSLMVGSCLHAAVHNDQPGVLEYVIQKFQGGLNVQDELGATALLKGCCRDFQNYKAVKTLLKLGADSRITDYRGLTAFDLLMRCKRNPEITWLFFNHGFDIAVCKVSALYQAIKSNRPWVQDIVAEAARRATMEPRIVGRNQHVLDLFEETKSYLSLCKKQLMDMQKITFYENVSFWDVIAGDEITLLKYAENFELTQAFFNTKCNGCFPIYCARTRHKFIEFLSRNRLIDLSTYIVCESIKLPKMYEVMQHEVMVHIENDDFFNILGCCPKP